MQLKIILSNGYTIGSFLRPKLQVPNSLLSNVVYSYKNSQCIATCIGETSNHLYSRYCEHLGVLPRTFILVSNPLKNNIRDHFETKIHSIPVSNFKILHTCKCQDLKLSESILIHKLCRNLIAQDSSTQRKFLC